MTDLRAALEADVVKVIDFMALTTEHDRQYLEQTAALVIDRILDTLADRADEWDRLATTTFDDYPALRAKSFTHNLVAVLRGPVSGSDSTMENQ